MTVLYFSFNVILDFPSLQVQDERSTSHWHSFISDGKLDRLGPKVKSFAKFLCLAAINSYLLKYPGK